MSVFRQNVFRNISFLNFFCDIIISWIHTTYFKNNCIQYFLRNLITKYFEIHGLTSMSKIAVWEQKKETKLEKMKWNGTQWKIVKIIRTRLSKCKEVILVINSQKWYIPVIISNYAVISQSFLRYFSVISQSFLSHFSGISQSFFSHFSVISQSLLSHFSVFSQSFLSHFSVFSQSFLSHFAVISLSLLLKSSKWAYHSIICSHFCKYLLLSFMLCKYCSYLFYLFWSQLYIMN